MVAVRVRVDTNQFPDIALGLNERVHAVVVETTAQVQQQMSSRAPYGRLRKGLRRQTVKYRGEVYAPWWWTFVNYGTRNQAAQPFVTQAVEAERAGFYRKLLKAITRG